MVCRDTCVAMRDANNCGGQSLRRAIGEYMAHYHEERNHQGLENKLIRGIATRLRTKGRFIGAHDLAECSATITAQLRDGRPRFWTIRASEKALRKARSDDITVGRSASALGRMEMRVSIGFRIS